jgi:hypothetical protein
MREESSREYYVTERGFLSDVAFRISTGENFIPLMAISLDEEREQQGYMIHHKEQFLHVTKKYGHN